MSGDGQEQGQKPAADQGAAPDKVQQFRLYASELTLRRLRETSLDLETKIPEWAGRDVVLLSREDAGEIPQSLISALNDEIFPSPEVVWEAAGRSLEAMVRAGFPADRLPDLNSKLSPLVLAGVFAGAAEGQFSAIGHDSVATGFIIGENHQPARDLAAGVSGLPKDMLDNIPDPEGKSWQVLAYAHEAQHLRQTDSRTLSEMIASGSDYILKRESDADIVGLQRYASLYTPQKTPDVQQKAINPSVPAAFESMRAIGSLRQSANFLFDKGISYSDHATSGAFDIILAGSSPSPNTPLQGAAGVLTVNSYAHALLGRVSGSLSPEEQEAMANMMVAAEDHDSSNLLAENFGKYLMEQKDGRGIAAALIHGFNVAREQPLQHYAAVKILYDRGTFANDPAAQTAAKEFINAFEKYVPSVHEQDATSYREALAGDDETIEKVMTDPVLKGLIDGVKRDLLESELLPSRPIVVPPISGPGV